MVKPREHRVPMMLSTEELDAIDTWRFANRVATRSEAIRRLVQIGILYDQMSANTWKDAADAMRSSHEAIIAFVDFLLARELTPPRDLVDQQLNLQPKIADLYFQSSALAVAAGELKSGGTIAVALERAAAEREKIEEANAPLKSLLDDLVFIDKAEGKQPFTIEVKKKPKSS